MTGGIFRGTCAALLVAGIAVHSQAARQGPTLEAALAAYEQQLAYGVYEKARALNSLGKLYVLAQIRRTDAQVQGSVDNGAWHSNFLSSMARADFGGFAKSIQQGIAIGRRTQRAETEYNQIVGGLNARWKEAQSWPADRYVTADVRETLGL